MPSLLLPTTNRELTSRQIFIRAQSADEETRSFEAVVASERQTAVFDWRTFDVVDEVLIARGGNFPGSIPLLDSHDRQGVDNILGTAAGFRQEGEQWIGRGQIAPPVEGNVRLAQVWENIRSGILTDVSIGYEVRDYRDIPAGDTLMVGDREFTAGNRTLRITTDWIVRELSLTAIGADSQAKIRSQQKPGQPAPRRRSYFSR